MTKGQKVYVGSDDSRQNGFDTTVVSVGNKFITVVDNYGRKYRFDKESLWCNDWSIYHLYESLDACKHKEKMRDVYRAIVRNIAMVLKQLSEDEVVALYNKIPNAVPYGEL